MIIGRRNADPAAVRELRERRGWRLEQMADAVWATPLEVAAWEVGTVHVPVEQACRHPRAGRGSRGGKRPAQPGAAIQEGIRR